jgi:hypothetical protein
VAGGGWTDLRSSEENLPAAQAAARQARDASGNSGRSRGRLTGDGPLRAAEHGFYRAGESDHPAWKSRAGSSHLGDGSAVPTLVRSSGVAACLLSCCTSARISTNSPRAAVRARWQAGGPTPPAAYESSGSGENSSTMDSAGSAMPSLIAGALRPHGSRKDMRRRPVKEQEAVWGRGKQGQER